MAGAMARRRTSPWLLTLALLTLPALASTPPMGGAVAFPRGGRREARLLRFIADVPQDALDHRAVHRSPRRKKASARLGR